MIRAGGRGARASAWLAVALALSSCATHGLAFRKDDRVEIVRPRDRERVRLPFTLEWRARDFPVGAGTIGGTGNYFAIFVDRSPMGPGQSLRALGDDVCKRTPGCPDVAWLADHRVFLATATSYRIGSLPDILSATTRRGVLEDHEITIVLMDREGRRIGESAFTVEFFYDRNR